MLFEGPIGCPRIAPHRLRIDVHKRVKLRVQPFDALKVSIGKFNVSADEIALSMKVAF